MSNKDKRREIAKVGGQAGSHNLEGFTEIRMNCEIGGGQVESILWYHKHRCFIITNHGKRWHVLQYRSDTSQTREFEGRRYIDSLRLVKKVRKDDYTIDSLLKKLLGKLRF